MLERNTKTGAFDRNEQYEQKLQLILAKAAELFNTKGTRATTLIDIAGRLNLTKTSLYYYVKTKEDLIYKCYVKTLDRLLDLAVAASVAPSGKDRLLAFAKFYMQNWRDIKLGERDHIALLTEVPTLKGGHLKDIMSRIGELRERIEGFMHEGMEDGTLEIEDTELAAQCYTSMVQWSMTWLDALGVEKLDFVIEQFQNVLSKGLATSSSYPLILAPVDAVSGEVQALSIQKGEAFLQAGTRYFNDRGYKGTSIDEISKALGATKGAFYYHIKNKEELLHKCFDHTLALMAGKQAKAEQEGNSGREKLELAAHSVYRVQNSDAGPLIRFTLLNAMEQKARIDMLRRTQLVSKTFGRFVAEGKSDGSIRNVDSFIAEQMFTGAINGAMPRSYSKESNNHALDSVNYFAILFKGLDAG